VSEQPAAGLPYGVPACRHGWDGVDRVLADWAETVQHMWLVAPIGRVRRIEAQQEGRVAASA